MWEPCISDQYLLLLADFSSKQLPGDSELGDCRKG